MTLLKITIRALLPAIALLLASCIDGREEFWLEADGSGRAEIAYSLPAAAAVMHGGETGIREMIAGFLHNTPAINTSSHEVVTEGNRLRINIHAVFDSAQDLQQLATAQTLDSLPAAVSNLAGTVKLAIHGRTLDFSRQVSPAKAIPGAAFLPASQFEGRRLTYIIHLPAAAAESNATRTEDAGRTLIWDVPLAHAVKSPVVTRFKMEIPIPWPLVSAIALPLSLVSGFAWLRLRKSRRNGPLPV